MAHIIGKFRLDGNEYILDRFKIGFTQAIDYKGQPQHETKGGQFFLSIGQAADNILYEWAKNSNLVKSGEVVFQTESGQTVIRISFNNAYCVRLECDVNERTGTHTSLVISPAFVKMGDTEHTNFWPE